MKKPESISFDHVDLLQSKPPLDSAHLEQLRRSGFYSSEEESEHGPASK